MIFAVVAAASMMTESAMFVSRVMMMAVTVAVTMTMFPIMTTVGPWYHVSMVRSSMIWDVVPRIVPRILWRILSRIVRIHSVE